jgi:transposase
MAENNGLRAGSMEGQARSRNRNMIRDARHLSAEDLDVLRASAMRTLAAGRSQKEVAEKLRVSRQALHNWARINREMGPEALKTGRRGRPKSRPLQPWQEARIASAVVLMPPAMTGLSSRGWTRKAIAQLVEHWFGLRLSTYMVGSYLKRWGFDSQRSVRYRFEQTPVRLLECFGGEPMER